MAVATAAGIVADAAAWLAGDRALASLTWALVTALALIPLFVAVVHDLMRREPGIDLIALLAMSAALALGQPLAGAVVALMLSGCLALEACADARARRELSALLARAPRAVRRHWAGGLESVPVGEVRRGGTLDLYPVVAKLIGGADPIGPMSRAHVEIRRLAGMLSRLIKELPEDGPMAADLRDLRRVLYGLHAVLRLHFAQEDESYLSLFEPEVGPVRAGREVQK